MGELERHVNGELPTPWGDRGLVRQAKSITDEVRLRGHRIDAQSALAGHIMKRTVDLDKMRRELAGDDPLLNEGMLRVMVNFMNGCIQEQLDAFEQPPRKGFGL